MFGICDSAGNMIARFVAPMTVRSNQPVYSSDTLSLKRQVTRRSAQRWEIETNLEPLTGNANSLFVDITTKGYNEIVYIKMPQNIAVINKRGNGLTAVASKTDVNTLIISSNTGNFIPKGTFFNITGGTNKKVYITTSDCNGNNSVGIYPPMYTALSNVTINIHNNVIGSFRYDLDTIRGMVFTDGILMDNGTIKLVEAL